MDDDEKKPPALTTSSHGFYPPPFDVTDELDHTLQLQRSPGPSPGGRADDGQPASLLSGPRNKKNFTPLPGRCTISATNKGAVVTYLGEQLLTERLNSLYPVLWLVSTQQSSHIAPLHAQIVRGRSIVITEDPGLHLVWYYDKVYVKPLPACLLNHAFWAVYLSANSGLRRAAMGYMRSYYHLVQSASDFHIALEKRLVPRGCKEEDFFHFVANFADVADDQVTLRYRYGDLRLSRLNLWSKLYSFELFYHKVYGQHGQYFATFVPPFVFVFGTLSVGLGAMQVVLQVQEGGRDMDAFARVSKWYSVACLILIVITCTFFPMLQILLLLRELVYVLTNGPQRSKRKQEKRRRTIELEAKV